VTAPLLVSYKVPGGAVWPVRSKSLNAANGMILRRPHRTVGRTPFLAAFRREFFEILVSSLAFAKLTANGRSIGAVSTLLIFPPFGFSL